MSFSELNIIFLTCKCQCKINFDEISPINQSNLKHQNLLKSIRVKRQRRHRGHRLLSSTSSFHQEADVIGQVALFLVLSRGTLLHSSIIIIRGIDSVRLLRSCRAGSFRPLRRRGRLFWGHRRLPAARRTEGKVSCSKDSLKCFSH